MTSMSKEKKGTSTKKLGKFFGKSTPAPDWPQSRSVLRIGKMYTKRNYRKNTLKKEFKDSNANIIKPLDFLKDIPTNGKIIDFGCGDGTTLCLIKKERPDITIIGVSATSVAKDNIQFIDEIYYCSLPSDPIQNALYTNHGNSVDLVIDTHGPIAYCFNPLKALIFELYMLKPGGKLLSLSTAVVGRIKDISRFGDKTTRFIIQQLAEKLDVTLTFDIHNVHSDMDAGIYDALIVRATRQAAAKHTLKEAYEMVEDTFNEPRVCEVIQEMDFQTGISGMEYDCTDPNALSTKFKQALRL